LFTVVGYDIFDLIAVLCDEAVAGVPVGLFDEVCEEDGLDFVEEECSRDGAE
jgi:hypothetical protein